MSMTPDFRRLLPVLVLGLLVRMAVILPQFGALNDPDNYLPLARSLAQGRGFCLVDGVPTAYRPPLYPIVLAPVVRVCGERDLPLGLAALHLGLALGTIVFTYATAIRWGLGPSRAVVAAAIVALDPVAVVQSRSVMTETLAAFLVAACLASVTLPGRRGIILSGIAFGLSSLCRPSLLPGAGLTALALAWVGPEPLRRRSLNALIFVAAILFTMSPWAVRNWRMFGEPIWTTSHGGYTLALANNPEYYADVVDGPSGRVWTGSSQHAWLERVYRETVGMSEIEADRHLRREALKMAAGWPGTFLRATLARLGRFWGIAPSPAVYPTWLRIATAAWTIPLWVALTVGLFRNGLMKWPSVVAPLIMIGLTVVHAFYWTDMRMRVPLIPAIALVAAGASLRRKATLPSASRSAVLAR
jgi:4-amino-4-deoxy-L-arabinose transferase-like glycosyltransferase